MDRNIRKILESLNIEKDILDGLTRVISSTGVFDDTNYSIRGFNGLEMKKGDKTFKAASGLQGGSNENKVLEGLFDKLDSMDKVEVKSRAPYKIMYRGVGFTFK